MSLVSCSCVVRVASSCVPRVVVEFVGYSSCQVLPVAEQLFVCTEGLLGEVLVAHSSVMAAFKNTSPETFAVAVRAMNKLACTSRVADVKLQIDRVSEGGSNEAASQLCTAARQQSLHDLQARPDLARGPCWRDPDTISAGFAGTS